MSVSKSVVDTSKFGALPFSVFSDLDLGRRIAPYLVEGPADVTICRGDVPERLEAPEEAGAAYQIQGRRLLLTIPNGSRCLVEDGRRITYASENAAAEWELPLFLLGSAWGALCYQRGLVALHASAVIVDGAVHAFTGRSGMGKSTLAAALAARGRDFFTDDVLILDPARLEPEPRCFTGQKDLKLWGDALGLTGTAPGKPVRDAPGFDKFYAEPMRESDALDGRLATLFILGREKNGGGASIERITGSAAVVHLLRSVYRPAFATAILGRRTLYEALARTVEHVAVYRFDRRFHPANFADGVAAIDRWIEDAR